jgi:hypothetical protein
MQGAKSLIAGINSPHLAIWADPHIFCSPKLPAMILLVEQKRIELTMMLVGTLEIFANSITGTENDYNFANLTISISSNIRLQQVRLTCYSQELHLNGVSTHSIGEVQRFSFGLHQ